MTNKATFIRVPLVIHCRRHQIALSPVRSQAPCTLQCFRGYPRLGGFGGQRLYHSAQSTRDPPHALARRVLRVGPTSSCYFNYSEDPPKLNPRILTTTDYDELLRPLLSTLNKSTYHIYRSSRHLATSTERRCLLRQTPFC
jgi:hypothetical protein